MNPSMHIHYVQGVWLAYMNTSTVYDGGTCIFIDLGIDHHQSCHEHPNYLFEHLRNITAILTTVLQHVYSLTQKARPDGHTHTIQVLHILAHNSDPYLELIYLPLATPFQLTTPKLEV